MNPLIKVPSKINGTPSKRMLRNASAKSCWESGDIGRKETLTSPFCQSAVEGLLRANGVIAAFPEFESMRRTLLILNVFLFEAERFGGV